MFSLNEGTRDKGSIYNLIIRSFAVLAVTVLLLAAVFFLGTVRILDNIHKMPDIEKLISQTEALSSEAYSTIRADRLLGTEGYFEILDSGAEILYCSDRNKKNEYVDDIFQYIPAVDASSVYQVVPMDKGEESGWLLLRYDVDRDDQLTGTAVMDSDGRFIYSNIDLKSDQISEDTLEFLFFNAAEEDTFIQQYRFTTVNGDVRHMFIHSTFDTKTVGKYYRKVFLIMIFGFLVLLLLLLLTAGMFLSRRVTNPMLKLSKAIVQTTKGKRIKIAEDEEPKEILDVIRLFNEMEEVLKKSEEKQKRMQDERRKMVADISHDLKTPITVIQGYVDAINDGLVSEEKKRAYLQVIGNKTVLISELINAFGDYSRLDHPGFQMNMEDGDLCEYIRGYIAEKYDELELSGYEFEADIPDRKMYGSFDRMQLKRAFENIIINAVKHTNPGTKIHIKISQEASGPVIESSSKHTGKNGWMRIELGDDGPGIPEEYRDAIFEPFVVGDESRTSGKGTGLGLSIARQIIRLHGGEITLLEKPGTVFCIELPLKE